MGRPVTGNTTRQEQRFQERAVERLARSVEVELANNIASTMRALGRHESNTGKQAEALAEHKAFIERALTKLYRKTSETFGERFLRAAVKHHFHRLETKEPVDTYESAISRWIRETAARKVTPIANTTMEQAQRVISRAVEEGIRQGMGQAELGKLINSQMREQGATVSRARGRVIARTESHSASNAATLEAAKATGLPMRKEWVSRRGPRTREDHDEANGQIVNLDAPFIVGGEELQYPGDMAGSGWNVINCGCAIVMIVD
jgi:uncharacterized protein with gpF-like domain